MNPKLRYDLPMKHLILLAILALMLTPMLTAQGVPASVTSPGFGGRDNNRPSGVPASVTSPGFGQNGQPARLFSAPTNSRPHVPGNHDRSHFRHEQQIQYYPYAVPYYPVFEPSEEQPAEDPAKENEYKGGPTIFDRRGTGTDQYENLRSPEQQSQPRERQMETATPSEEKSSEPVPDQPITVLVFKDGHQLEIANYAILGNTLFDLTPGHRRKIALVELDLTATVNQNDNRGVDFRLPVGVKVN